MSGEKEGLSGEKKWSFRQEGSSEEKEFSVGGEGLNGEEGGIGEERRENGESNNGCL